MTEEDISQEFRLTKKVEICNYFVKEIDENEWLSNTNKKVCTTQNYIKNFFSISFCSHYMYLHFPFGFFNRHF